MNVQKGSFLPIEQLTQQYLGQRAKERPAVPDSAVSFQEILSQRVEQADTADDLKFSKHAKGRLDDRNIELTNGQLERLLDGARKAGEKGIQDSLVIVDQLAFIVNIPNRTVVTAMDSTQALDNIFTNIDGAVIM